jgi:sirohydrochlorin ferrochelatase
LRHCVERDDRRKDRVARAEQTDKSRVIVIVDHGSRSQRANAVVVELARLVQVRAQDAAAVRFAHLELAEPRLPAVIDECVAAGARAISVQPFFLAPGKHASKDLPELVADARRRHPHVQFELGRVIGADPLVAELVASRCGLG